MAELTSNREAHHTDVYHNHGMIVRRGQSFKINLTFNEEIKDWKSIIFTAQTGPPVSGTSKTRAVFPISGSWQSGSWSAVLEASPDTTLRVSITSPPNAAIGRYELSVEITFNDVPTTHILGNFILLFNPWCPDDEVYIDDEDERQEYVLNESGIIYMGNEKSVNSIGWNYGQFEENILNVCLDILDRNTNYLKDPVKDCTQRNDASYVGRVVSAMVNSNDESGVLEGRWEKDFPDGTDPNSWSGSVEILLNWQKEGYKPVKYGQCWVFAGVMCTVLRCLGIPTRTITNFLSAHNTDANLSIDLFYDSESKFLDDVTEDSIWNFHVWNESWFARRDLGHFYDGWQVIDSTPQEESGGLCRCGPSSVKAIKEGDVHMAYDTIFVFAEVNADRTSWVYHSKDKKEKVYSDTKSVGQSISTKAVGSNERIDVTSNYKYPEGSVKEREIFNKALLRLDRINGTTENDMAEVPNDIETQPESMEDVRSRTPEREQDVRPRTPESVEDVRPRTPERAEDVRPRTPESAEDVTPRTPESAEDITPRTPERAEDVRPRTPERAEDVRPRTPEREEEVRPRMPERAEDVRPRTPEREQDVRHRTPERVEDVTPRTPERVEDVRPRTPERAEDVRPRTPDREEEVRLRMPERAEDARPRTPERAEDIRHRTPERAEDVRPRMPDRLEDVRPRTPERPEDVRPRTPERLEDVRPRTPERAEGVRPRMPERAEGVRPRMPERAEDVRPRTPERLEDVRSRMPERMVDVRPRTPERTVDVRPRTPERTVDVRPRTLERTVDVRPRTPPAHPVPAPRPQISGKFRLIANAIVGEDISLVLNIKNHSSERKSVQVRMSCFARLYTGRRSHDILATYKFVSIGPKRETNIPLVIYYSEYGHLYANNTMIGVAALCEEDSGEKLLVRKDITLDSPPINIWFPDYAIMFVPVIMEIRFANPLMLPVEDCILLAEGSGLIEGQVKAVVPPMRPRERIKLKLEVIPWKRGIRQIQVHFASKHFSLKGFKKVVVRPW